MSDSQSASVEMTKGEARVVIAALADEEMTAIGERATRLQNVQDHLAAEFEFDQYRESDRTELAGSDDSGWFTEEWLDDGRFDTDDTERVELARAEADAVTDALAAFELDETHGNAGTAENVRERVLDAFGGDLVGAGDD
ncbi:hypothetical protein [Halorussus litoreus]|uniref:hypothetical protein n=1 Tax=Halorussus litoreus TaxID=1710536 RepID=UPI000E2368A1|nr:hypothetical protein [Halorussus litoreus]